MPWIPRDRLEALQQAADVLPRVAKELETRTKVYVTLEARCTELEALLSRAELLRDELEHDRDRQRNLAESALRTVELVGKQLEQLTADSRRERARVDDLVEKLDAGHSRALESLRSLADGFASQVAELRRDGFNPSGASREPTYAERIATGQAPDAAWGAAEQNQATAAGARAVSWAAIVEAAQDRAGGALELYNKIMTDATRWRDAGIELAEIETRIYNGFGG